VRSSNARRVETRRRPCSALLCPLRLERDYAPGRAHCRQRRVVPDSDGYHLKQAGYEVATYPTAEHFLGHLPNENVLGCILLKVRMQGLSGPALQSA
jgi:hypothetical protein